MVAEATRHLLPGQGGRDLTDDERMTVEVILDAAALWRAGTLPLRAFANAGPLDYRGRESCGYGRFVAVRTVSPDDPRRADLLAAIDEALRYEGLTVTNHGTFSREELATPAGYGVRIR